MGQSLDEIVRSTFRRTIEFMPGELRRAPLASWNESVFRYFFCRHLPGVDEGVQPFVECERIDLVLHGGDEKAFVEFKFYVHPRRFDPYTGASSGFKGGPGLQNLQEFQRCVQQLHDRKSVPGLSKYVVLAYADPITGTKRYSDYYDDYRHSDERVTLDLQESAEFINAREERIQAKLFTVDAYGER
ncbi:MULTISPECIES: hypothetical protein [Micromonospora]|uniref:Restriction endonuclease n=1 Tax=Micromonospora chalcea TaxID=1874 RepID=A0ABX9Y520_MICCH|nr:MULTISPECIES: hypothetical protein [Micromonospora]ODB78133.1 hypothetical protein A8711_28060 [Micromonospora sp. II]RQW90976.1 hypothetical protein DLJ60_18800 [Micromonospora chalcea]RQX57936.1 hypothetical protein DLJ57_04730 [Micromonospora chalcea]